jgi:hypothetical protein
MSVQDTPGRLALSDNITIASQIPEASSFPAATRRRSIKTSRATQHPDENGPLITSEDPHPIYYNIRKSTQIKFIRNLVTGEGAHGYGQCPLPHHRRCGNVIF